MQVEILGPDGRVHYRREHDDPDVAEALRSCEYSVFVPNRGFDALNLLPCVNSSSHECLATRDGLRVWSANRDPSFTVVERIAD